MKFIALLCLATAINSTLAARVDYTVSLKNPDEVISVTACFKGVFPRHLESSLSSAIDYLRLTGREVERHRKKLRINKKLSSREPCVAWQVDSRAYRKAHPTRGRWNKTIAADVFKLDTGLLLWRPTYLPPDTEFFLTVKHKQTTRLSAPFLRLRSSKDSTTFRLNQTPSFMSLPLYVGAFPIHQLKVANTSADIAFLSPLSFAERKKISRWIERSLNAITTVTPTLPVDKVQIIVIDVESPKAQATPYAMVYRGEGNNITFYINKHAKEEEFVNDWTAYHEFSHLLLPFIDRRDAWLSEGFASYYQYIVMGRSKILTSEQTFNRLWGGIQRGKSNYKKTQHQSLLTVSRKMRQLRSHRRVYWSGALVWLTAELELQNRGTNLESLLQKFHRCCYNKHSIWTAQTLGHELDALLEKPLFSRLFDNARTAKNFPDYQSLFEQLNLTIKDDDSLHFGPSQRRDSMLAN